jgi:succinyl-CoA synthetase beta subunit
MDYTIEKYGFRYINCAVNGGGADAAYYDLVAATSGGGCGRKTCHCA